MDKSTFLRNPLAMPSYRIPSIANTCSIFQLLTSTKKALSVSNIAKELDLPRTSVFRIMKTLEEEKMVHAIGKNYITGHRLINIGLQVVSQIPERQLSVPILQELTKLTKESAHFAILSGAHALLIEVCDSPHSLRVASRPGTLADMHCSGSGKCMLAYASPAELENLLDRITFTQHTTRSHPNKKSLLPELPKIRERGYALDNAEYHDHVRAIYAPVFNDKKQLIGVIGITAALSSLPKSRIPKVAKQVVASADQLSIQLGYQPST